MEKRTQSSARDQAKPQSHYRKIASSLERDIVRAKKNDSVGSLVRAPGMCLRAGLALYSAGAPAEDCLHWFDEAVSQKLRFLSKKSYSFAGYATIEEDLELYPAGALIDRGDELIDAFRRCKFEKPSPPRVEGLMEQLCATITDNPIEEKSSVLEDLKKNAKEWLVMPPLFKAVAQKNAKAFGKTLHDFLSLYWAKEVRIAGSSEYVGKWSLLSTALCKKMRLIPDLPEATKQFIAVELARVH